MGKWKRILQSSDREAHICESLADSIRGCDESLGGAASWHSVKGVTYASTCSVSAGTGSTAMAISSQSRGLSASTSSHQQRTAHSTFDSSKRRQCRRKYRDAAKVFAALPCASCRMAWLLCKQLPHVPRSCHHVFDHRTKGVCLEGLSGERTKSAPVLLLLLHAHMHMHGAEWTVPGQTTACGRAW